MILQELRLGLFTFCWAKHSNFYERFRRISVIRTKRIHARTVENDIHLWDLFKRVDHE